MHDVIGNIKEIGKETAIKVEKTYRKLRENSDYPTYLLCPPDDLCPHNLISLDCSCCPTEAIHYDNNGYPIKLITHHRFDQLDRFLHVNKYVFNENYYRN